MPFSEAERRTLLNLWCRIARADGVIDEGEVEQLSELFYGLGDGAITAEQIESWLENGPPEPECKLPSEALPLFLERARAIMSADQEINLSESNVLKQLQAKWFER